MPTDQDKRAQFETGELIIAYKVATEYFLRRRPDGSLERQKEVAREMGFDPPRFGEFLKIAWQAGIIDVVINPPDGIGSDYREVRKLEMLIHEKLQPFSPPLRSRNRAIVRPHKLLHVHIVPGSYDIRSELNQINFDDLSYRKNVFTRICKKAAEVFQRMILDIYHADRAAGKPKTRIGVSCGETCDRVVTVTPLTRARCQDMVIVPIMGLIGNRRTAIDANFLAYRLAARYACECVKIGFPCNRPLDLEEKHLKKVRPLRRALEEIGQTQAAISSVSAAAYSNGQSTMLARRVITAANLRRVIKLGAVAEIACHYLDIHGTPIPSAKVGFVPFGVSLAQMQRMPRFLVVVPPEMARARAAVAVIKAGIASDIVMDHSMARYLLDDAGNSELALRPEDRKRVTGIAGKTRRRGGQRNGKLQPGGAGRGRSKS